MCTTLFSVGEVEPPVKFPEKGAGGLTRPQLLEGVSSITNIERRIALKERGLKQLVNLKGSLARKRRALSLREGVVILQSTLLTLPHILTKLKEKR